MSITVQADAKIVYQPITAADVNRLGSMVRLFGRENRLCDQFNAPIDFKHFNYEVSSLIDMGVAFGFMAVQDERVLGVILYTITKHTFTGLMSSSEIMWFVLPEYRNGSMGVRLLKMMEDDVEEQGVELSGMFYLKNSMPEKIGRFYEKRGYEETETQHLRRIYPR